MQGTCRRARSRANAGPQVIRTPDLNSRIPSKVWILLCLKQRCVACWLQRFRWSFADMKQNTILREGGLMASHTSYSCRE